MRSGRCFPTPSSDARSALGSRNREKSSDPTQAAAGPAEPPAVNVASLDDSQFPDLTAVVDVLDANNRPVAGLTRANFQATVGDQPAPISDLQAAVDAD